MRATSARRFAKMAESSKAFVITQFGLSCFEACGPGAYSARTFNFYVFPRPHGSWNKRFLCDASSLTFLSQHGFDFNKCIGQGVPFMPVRQRDWQLQQVRQLLQRAEVHWQLARQQPVVRQLPGSLPCVCHARCLLLHRRTIIIATASPGQPQQ